MTKNGNNNVRRSVRLQQVNNMINENVQVSNMNISNVPSITERDSNLRIQGVTRSVQQYQLMSKANESIMKEIKNLKPSMRHGTTMKSRNASVGGKQ